MITKTTSLDNSYNSLFDEIREKSNGNIDINNIEGFFGNIENIAQLDKKFLRLPLDEPMFKIDANTRNIAVPNEFKSNGLSVQGDHLAETVFFCIDRYFDYTDLSSTDISINWKMGTQQGRTKNFIMNKDILPGYIVFGWPINKDITMKSGSLTFAVQFSKERNEEIVYNFNTLAANITIKDGLIIDSSIQVASLENDILSILTNSAFGEGDAAVGDIVWITGDGLVLNASEVTNTFEPAAFSNIINLNTNINEEGPYSIPVDLYAEGYVDSATEIRYTDKTGNNIPVFLKIPAYEEGMELPENQKYYVPDTTADPIAYKLASQAEIAAWNAEDEEDRIDLYICLAKLTVSTAGDYIVKAQGEKFNNDIKIGAGEVAETAIVQVPAAEVPSAIDIIASEIDINKESNYSFADNIENVVYLDGEDSATLIASAVLDSFGALQFIWKKKLANATNYTNMDENNLFVLENISSKNIDTEGKYQVSVINFKNGVYADTVNSAEWTASFLASPILNAVCKRNGVEVEALESFNSQSSSMSQRSITLNIEDIDRGENARGTIEYQWKKGDEIIGTNSSIVISTEGTYTPIVRNIYNGSIYTKILPNVFVNDSANDD